MAKGDGSITEVRRGVWRVCVSFGTDPVTGKRQKVQRNVQGTKAEARKERDRIRREHESGLDVDASKVAFSEFVEVWHQAKLTAGTVAPDTAERNRRLVMAAAPYIGKMPLREIDARTIETLYATIRKDKLAAGGSFGGTTMRKLHVMLKQLFKKAVDYDMILRNPCDRVLAPKEDEPERKALTVKECSRLLACVDRAEAECYDELAAKESRQMERGKAFGRSSLQMLTPTCCVVAVRIAVATGMRRGEVFWLTWGSVALNQRCIAVSQSLTVRGEVKKPKSRAGLRTVNIDDDTASHLEHWKARQAVELSKIGVRQDNTTPVCCANTGGYMNLDHFERWWRPWRAANGFEGLKFHELRHTQATQLLANGVDVKTVQTRMGHANASITLNWYSHAVPENDRKAADMLGRLLADRPSEEPRIIEVKTA
ncbi:MAG: tyrosine-type recombinase/integrase [Gordonibacter sp.]|uniref:tyrosine-type recombinase/integrase n=1 Tax=Gordonibacter sp. TaxID=1968902 RepID=UPI002FC5D1C9